MSLIAKKKSSAAVPPIAAGTYVGVCVGVVDVGEQKNETFGTFSPKVTFIFEIASERVVVDDESRPRWLSETYTSSLNEKSNLYKTLMSWRGRGFTEEELDGFDLAQMVGKPCQLQVLVVQKKDGSECNKIAGVFGLPKGLPAPKPENPLMTYQVEDGENEVFLTLPEWIRERIKKSTEWRASHNGTEKLGFDDPEPDNVAHTPAAEKQTEEPIRSDVEATEASILDPDDLPF